MGTDSWAELPRALTRAQARFELWRRTRSERRIPEDLWALAAKLADSYGVQATAQVLRLNPQSLREHIHPAEVVASAGTGASRGFVELPAVGLGGWVVELSSPGGARLRLEAASGQALDLEALTRGRRQGLVPSNLCRPSAPPASRSRQLVVCDDSGTIGRLEGPMSDDAGEPTQPARGGSKDWLRRIEANQVLFEEGAVDRRLFVLIDGKVEILKGGRLLAELGVSESFIGEVSALTGKPRSATARTARASTFLVVEQIEDIFEMDGAWGLRLARELARRLDRMNDRFQRLQEVLDLTRQEDSNWENVTTTLKAVVKEDETTRPI